MGRNFRESLNKVLRSLENKNSGFWTVSDEAVAGEMVNDPAALLEDIKTPTESRIYKVELALRLGCSIDEVYAATGIDPWFLGEIQELINVRNEVAEAPVLTADIIRLAKYNGFSDKQIAVLRPEIDGEAGVRKLRQLEIHPVFKTVDMRRRVRSQDPYHYPRMNLILRQRVK